MGVAVEGALEAEEALAEDEEVLEIEAEEEEVNILKPALMLINVNILFDLFI